MDIIRSNTTIPVVLTDEKGNISSYVNYEFDGDSLPCLLGNKTTIFTISPIEINYFADKKLSLLQRINYIYRITQVLDDLVKSFFLK